MGLTLAPPGGSSGDGDDEVAGWSPVPPEVYELSRSRNIIHIVLDMFPSHILAEIRDADPSTFDRAWSGFAFYRNHLGAFPTTIASMPAMLTGIPYRNDMRISDYRRAHPSVFHALGQHGYRLRSATADGRDHPRAAFPGAEDAVAYTIPRPYGSYRNYLDSTSAQLLDLSLFRHAPHGVKADVYRDGAWLLQQRVASHWGPISGVSRALGDTAFLMDYASSIEAAGESPVYSFLHVITPHPPIATDADCEFVDEPVLTRAGYVDQARCALMVVRALLDRLRTLDLYDRSAIVVTSDYGLGVFPPRDTPPGRQGVPSGKSLLRMRLDATPLLLIKPFGAQGTLQLSNAPTSIVDLPATLLDLAGLPNTLGSGKSALALDPAMRRERTYADHSWGRENNSQSRYFDVLHLYSVNGRASSSDAWRYQRAIFNPTANRNAQYRAHRIGMSAAEDDTVGPAGGGVYRTDDYAAFFLRPDTERIAFDVRQAPDSAPQTVTVRVDGHMVGRLSLSGDTWRGFEHPVEPRDVGDSPFCIELLVSPAAPDVESRSHGVMVRGGF